MSTTNQTPEKKTFGQKLGAAWKGFWRFVFRLLIAVVIIGGLGAAAYFGIPYLYRSYVQPLQDVQGEVATLKQETADRAKQVNDRLLSLQDDIQSLRSKQAALEGKLDKQQDEIKNLQKKADELAAEQAAIQSQMDALNNKIKEAVATANDAQTAGEALQASWDEWKDKLVDMQQQVYVMQVMESLLRARILVGQHDLGAAQKELATTAAGLEWLADNTNTPDAPFAEAHAQVLLAQKALPQAPDVAVQDIEAAWQLLSALIPQATPQAPTAIPTQTTPTPTSTATPTPTPNP